jgi:hypothetical protein
MARKFRPYSKDDLERTALDYTLTKYLSQEARDGVLTFFEVKHKILMDSEAPLSRREVSSVLEAFFGEGGNLIVSKFNEKLDQLEGAAHTGAA